MHSFSLEQVTPKCRIFTSFRMGNMQKSGVLHSLNGFVTKRARDLAKAPNSDYSGSDTNPRRSEDVITGLLNRFLTGAARAG